MSGWIKIHRKIFENPFYFSEKFTRCQAWFDLLLLANFNDGFFYKRGIKVVVSRGQVGYDLDSLGLRWKWSRGKVDRFINELEKEKQVIRQKTNVTTLISIINYELYQSDDNTDSKADNKPDGHQTVNQTETNKNDKKNKKDKKVFIAPTQIEVENYFLENGYSRESAVKAFNYYNIASWSDSRGKNVINWKQKMLSNWFKAENKIHDMKNAGVCR